MNKLTKVIRLEIVKPVNADWKTVGSRLRELQRMTAEALNYCIRRYYLGAAEAYDQIKKSGAKVKVTDLNINFSLSAELGKFCSETVSSAVYDQLYNIARHRFRNDWFDILVRGNKSLPSYRNDCPIYIRATGVGLAEENGARGKDRLGVPQLCYGNIL